MEFIDEVLKHHAEVLKEEGTKMEEDDQSVCILNDAVVVISLEDETLGVNVIAGEPYHLDISTGLLAEGDSE